MKNHKELFEALLAGETIVSGVRELRLSSSGNLVFVNGGNCEWSLRTILCGAEIKQLDPKKIYLYETYNSNMSKILCDKDGHQYNVVDKRRCIGIDSYTKFRKKNIINPDKPSMILNAETWERIDE